MAQWANDVSQPWTELKFNQFGLHATLAVKTIKALYYKAGGDRELTIVLVMIWTENAPIRCSTAPSLIQAQANSDGVLLSALGD